MSDLSNAERHLLHALASGNGRADCSYEHRACREGQTAVETLDDLADAGFVRAGRLTSVAAYWITRLGIVAAGHTVH